MRPTASRESGAYEQTPRQGLRPRTPLRPARRAADGPSLRLVRFIPSECRPYDVGHYDDVVSRVRATGVIPALVAALATATLGAAPPPHDPSSAGRDGRAAARLISVPVRIAPAPGEARRACATIDARALEVELRGRSIEQADIELDRAPRPTLHALVLDRSSSLGEGLPRAREAAAAYLARLAPPLERGLVLVFDEGAELRQAVTNDRERLVAAVRDVRQSARTALLDALHATLGELGYHTERPVVVLLTDGADVASVHGLDDVRRAAAALSDLTLFVIGVELDAAERTEQNRQALRELAEGTGGLFLEVDRTQGIEPLFASITDALEREAILTVVDPEPEAELGELRVRSRERACRITRLGSRKATRAGGEARALPHHRPPHTWWIEPGPTTLLLERLATRRATDPRCPAAGQKPRAFWLAAGDDAARGCGLDVARSFGLLHQPGGAEPVLDHAGVELRVRPIVVQRRPIEALPRSPSHVLVELGRLAPPDGLGERHVDWPWLVEGSVLDELRPLLARTLYEWPEYRLFALERLEQAAETEIDRLAARLAHRFPQASPEVVRQAARSTPEGRALLERAAAPGPTELVPFLAAWLGDVPASELFAAWEQERIDERLSGVERDDDSFPAAWRAVRAPLAAPTSARIVVPLVSGFDPVERRVGLWRIVLPRPSWLEPRRVRPDLYGRAPEGSLDLVPELPLGWIALDELARRDGELLAHLRARGYRVARIGYRLLGSGAALDPERAFDLTRVELAFETDAAGTDPARLELEADIALRAVEVEPLAREAPSRVVHRLERLATRTGGDEALGARLAALHAALAAPPPPPDPTRWETVFERLETLDGGPR